MTADDEPFGASELDASVAERIIAELGRSDGHRVLDCLRTAKALLDPKNTGHSDLRWAESAAYNIREALDSVVRSRTAGEGGLSAAVSAWERYKVTIQLAGADEAAAFRDLAATMDELARDKERQAYTTRKLLNWFQQQTGVAPIPGENDPTRQYNELRGSAARILHADASRAEVKTLLAATLAWFDRFFAAPSDLASKVESLAKAPYSPEGLSKFRSLALNAHHVRLFLARITDPDWLEPLHSEGLIGPPKRGELWSVAALASNVRQLPDEPVARLLQRILEDLKSLPRDDRPACAFEIIRTASSLGPSGLHVVLEVLRRYPSDRSTQAIAISAAKDLDLTDPAHEVVADAVIGNEARDDGVHHTREVVDRLMAGLTPDNLDERIGLLVAKLRRLSKDDHVRYVAIDIAALPLEGDEDERTEPLLLLARSLAAAISTARDLGMPGHLLVNQIKTIPGELGERLVCQVLAGADDIDRDTKVAHLELRLASETATGDDQALVKDLSPFSDDEVERLRAARGQPSPLDPRRPNVPYGENWPRLWRWSMVLPEPILTGCHQAIAAVTETHGPPDPSALARRVQRFTSATGRSPITADALTAMEVMEAATSVAAWRPSPDDPWGISARELARSLERVTKANPEPWTENPSAIVRTLREPVYVDHYFRALVTAAKAVAAQAPALIRAITLVRREQWEPTVLGSDSYEFESDWSVVETVAVELIDALADADADLADDLEVCWAFALDLATTLPEDLGSPDQYDDLSDFDDPLYHAINSSHGKGLEAVLALGGWEHRNQGAASERLEQALTQVLAVEGAVGAQLRSVVAGSRPFVEGIAGDWLEDHHDTLFGGALGRVAFDQTLKYSRPTKTFYERSFSRLVDAARRGAPNAVGWLLIAHLWDEPEYTFEAIISGLEGNLPALDEAGQEIARLSTGLTEDQRHITERGIAFWERLLGEPRSRVPAPSLEGLGRWAMTPEVEQPRWLELTERTIQLTGGSLDFRSQVAERCRDIQPSAAALRILTQLLGGGETWEQHHLDSLALEAIGAAADSGMDDEAFRLLRERLIQRGRHAAAEIEPRIE